MSRGSGEAKMRRLPSVERLVGAAGEALSEQYGREALVRAARATLDAARPGWRESGAVPSMASLSADVSERVKEAARPSLRHAVNATGVVLHTGLGRAVLPPTAVEAALDVARGHSTLEIDAGSGERGSRQDHVAGLLREITGAEAAMAVNNDAGAVLLMLAALARGGEVIVSRGELVEIGGGFRVPDVMAESGARLVEVGTTNKTRLADYARAIRPETAALLKVHPSNFRVTGFTESVSITELSALARENDLPLLDDLGSGALVDLAPAGLRDEPMVQRRLEDGADVVAFSGDKLLGGPQAGILVGRADLIGAMARHPLARALRCDKVTLALLEHTLRLYRDGRAWDEIPTLRALATSAEAVRASAETLAGRLNALDGVNARVVRSVARVGAGSLPGEDVPSFAVAVEREGFSPNALAAALRAHEPPVFGHVSGGDFLLEPRSLLERDTDAVVSALSRQGHAGNP